MRLDEFSRINRIRCEGEYGFKQPLDSWSLSDWMNALVGELCEASDVVERLNYHQNSTSDNTAPEETIRQELADKLGDIYTHLDLLAQRADIDLQQAVISRWDLISERIGYPGRLTLSDDDLVDRVAYAMWREEAIRAGNPLLAARRTFEAWEESGKPTHGRWIPLARAAIDIMKGSGQ